MPPIASISSTSSPVSRIPVLGTWNHPAVIARSNFQQESLCCWSLNLVMGCTHSYIGCCAPDTSAGKQVAGLSALGVAHPHTLKGGAIRQVLVKNALRKLFLYVNNRLEGNALLTIMAILAEIGQVKTSA